MATHTAMTQGNDPDIRSSIEKAVGILHFVSPKEQGWNGILRQRFTDFQVHEITKDGEVLHLHDYSTNAREFERKEAAKNALALAHSKDPKLSEKPQSEVKPASDQRPAISVDKADVKAPEGKADDVTDGSIASSDLALLVELLDQATADALVALHEKIRGDPKAKPKSHGSVEFPQLDRAVRGRVHSEIRRIFSGKIDTETNSEGIIKAAASGNSGNKQWGKRAEHRKQQSGQGGGQAMSGKYLHFSLYKENKDTMEAIGHISRILNLKASFFGTAGTKDRRAVTVQRVSMRARDPKKLLFINDKVFGVKIGDFKFEQKDIHLGCHSGNEFIIVMKDCTFQGTENESFERRLEIAQSVIDSALAKITSHGFINYYGTQRFGTFEIGTHVLGMKILKGDFEGAVKDLLSFDPTITNIDTSASKSDEFVRYDDIARAKALEKYEETGDADEACKSLPRRCNTEWSILKHLGKQHNDFIGALLSVTRNMRNMYIHAYQSFVWNFVASKRWERFGSSVVKGDLVFASSDSVTAPEARDAETDDEETIHLGEAKTDDDEPRQSVHVLTAEDVASGRYSIFDVILPSPGTTVVYPDNEIGEYYVEFMGKEDNGGLNPHDMHRRQKEFSLVGAYRKFMGNFIGVPTGSVRSYSHEHDQLVPTDMDLIKSRRAKEAEERAAIRREMNPKWHAFAENVQANESRQSQDAAAAAAEIRKTENTQDDPTDIRVTDTWVQTSLDGSKKRIKVATHASEINSTDAICPAGDVMDIDEPDATAKEAPTKPAPQTQASTNTPGSVPTSAHASTLQGTETVNFRGVDFKTSPSNSQGPDQVVGASPTADNSSERQIPSEKLTQGPVVLPTSTEAAPSKIAVVLKFALHSSVYATMVLRELQG